MRFVHSGNGHDLAIEFYFLVRRFETGFFATLAAGRQLHSSQFDSGPFVNGFSKSVFAA